MFDDLSLDARDLARTRTPATTFSRRGALWLGAWLAAVLLMPACGGGGSEDEPAAERAPLNEQTSALFQEGATCSLTMLGGACKGPWAYRAYTTPCYNERRDPLCPKETHYEARTCLVARTGLTFNIVTDVACAPCSNPSQLSTKCANEGALYRAMIAGNTSIVGMTPTVSNVVRVGNGHTGTCTVDYTNAGTAQDVACGTYPVLRDGICRLPAFGEAPKGECGDESADRASAPGLTLAALAAAQPYLNPSLPKDCSTQDDLAVEPTRLTTTLARLSAAHAVWTNLPAPAEQEDAARRDLARNAKLMYELGTVASSPAELAQIRALYTSQPEQEMGCGVTDRPQVSEACRATGISNGLEGALELCTRMLSSHVVSAVFTVEAERCFQLLARPELQAPGCGVEYRTLVETVAEKLFDKLLNEVAKPAGAAELQGLSATLSWLDRWYTSAAIAFAAAPAELDDATGRVLRAFWKRVYDVGAVLPIAFPAGDAGSDATKAMLATLFSQRIEVDRQVLAAAYAAPAPIDEIPLLLITADALTSLQERLHTSAPLYDFACRIKGCTAAMANEATLLLRLIGAIGDDAALQEAITAASPLVRAPWRDAFTALRARRPALTLAYQRASGNPAATLAELYQPNIVPAAAGLKALVQESSAMWASYASHGTLLPRAGGTLRTALNESKLTDTKTLLAQTNALLKTAIDDHQRARGDFANVVLTRINQQQHQARLDAELALMESEYDDLGADLDGLMASQDQAEQMIGSFMSTYTRRAGEPGWLPAYPITTSTSQLTVHPSEARGDGGRLTDDAQLPGIAVRDPAQPAQPLMIQVAKGDLLNFQISGTWAPTCALRAAKMGRSNSTFEDPVNAMTSSEGYSTSWGNSKFHATEHSSTDFSSRTTTKSVCGNIKANLLQVSYMGYDLGNADVSASYCKAWQTGHSEADTTTQGRRNEASAQFAGGLRLAGTPFAKEPAGALLAVEVELVEGVERIINVHVVRPNASILFRGAGKVYLVVNDKGGCTPLNTGTLNVSYSRAQPAAVAAQTLAETMANALAALSTQAQLYIAQGSVTAAELSALQTSAYDQLRAACNGCELSAYPEQVRGMFDAWLTAQVASIERQTRISAAIRALTRLSMRAAAMKQDILGAIDSSRLTALMTSWQLGHLAYHELHGKADLVLEVGNDYVLPMMRIRYPQALTALRSLSNDDIEAVRTADWTMPFDEQANRLRVLIDAVVVRLQQAGLVGGNREVPVILAFPKPVALGAPARPSIPGANVVPPERLSGVWEPCTTPGADGYCLKAHPVFTVTPEDVYGRVGIGLGCTEVAPIVRAQAFYAANTGFTGNAAWNNSPYRFDSFRHEDITFPTEAGPVNHRIGAELAPLTNGRMRSIAGTATNAWSTFATYALASHDFEGATPFGSFALELGAFATSEAAPFATAHTIAVIFQLDTRGATGPLAGLTACTGGH